MPFNEQSHCFCLDIVFISLLAKTRILVKEKRQQICPLTNTWLIGKNVFPFLCDQGKKVELEKILQFNIFVLKFKKGKNVKL